MKRPAPRLAELSNSAGSNWVTVANVVRKTKGAMTTKCPPIRCVSDGRNPSNEKNISVASP